MNWVDLIQASTQIISTLIAGVVAFLAWKTYLKEPAQESEPEAPQGVREERKLLTSLVVFDTKKQTTTLKVSDIGLECHLKNKEKGQERLQWTISTNDASIYLERKQYRVYPGYKANTGTFSIGPRTNWLYSKKLFPEAIYLEDQIKLILQSSSV